MDSNQSEFPVRDWSSYYKHKSNLIPRDTLLKVLELFDDKKNKYIANDVGCGHGADTLELLKRGWKVNAFDSEQEGLLLLEQSLPEGLNENLTLLNQEFENIELPQCDLLNASYSIPFCSPDHFTELWNKIESCIKENGRFAGTLFGKNDEWAANKKNDLS